VANRVPYPVLKRVVTAGFVLPDAAGFLHRWRVRAVHSVTEFEPLQDDYGSETLRTQPWR
jgi:hypothetical protein